MGKLEVPYSTPEEQAKADAKTAERFRAFALKRGIRTDVPGWQNVVILKAASEHPELDSERRGRGRPAKERVVPFVGGLLGPRIVDTRQLPTKDVAGKRRELLDLIEHNIPLFEEVGAKTSDAAMIRAYVEQILGDKPGTELFEANVRTYREMLSRARKDAFRPKRCWKIDDIL